MYSSGLKIIIMKKWGWGKKCEINTHERSTTVPATHELSARMLKLAGDLEILGHEGEVTGRGSYI